LCVVLSGAASVQMTSGEMEGLSSVQISTVMPNSVSVCSFHLWLLDSEYFITILLRLPSMVLIHACRRLSRDYLLAINSQRRCAAVLDTTVRDLISCLRLRRRGRRAGEHQRRSLVQNVNINNRRSHITLHSKEIPVIIGCRANVNSGHICEQRVEPWSNGAYEENEVCVWITWKSQWTHLTAGCSIILFSYPDVGS